MGRKIFQGNIRENVKKIRDIISGSLRK